MIEVYHLMGVRFNRQFATMLADVQTIGNKSLISFGSGLTLIIKVFKCPAKNSFTICFVPDIHL